MRGYGYAPHSSPATTADVHRSSPPPSTGSRRHRRHPARRGRRPATSRRPRWPMIVLRTPKGWTGPRRSTGCRSRARSAPTRSRSPSPHNAEHRASSRTGCAATARGAVRRDRPLIPDCQRSRRRDRRMSANPHANGGGCCVTCRCRTSATTPSTVAQPATG
jgi:xylulose-5-phosphate/fructose-6-phosphate phosphoketolase